MIKDYILLPAMLQAFAGEANTNITTDSGLTKEMKTFYDKALIRLAEPELVHDQFGQKRPIPQNGGKTIEFRKYTPLAKQTTALTYTDEDSNDNLTVLEVRKATRTLKSQNAPKFGAYYVGIIHPDVAFDLMSDPNWKYPHQYKDTQNLYSEEIGEVGGVRFVETTEAKKFVNSGASSRDVYATMILGQNAYGVTEVSGGGLQSIVKQLGSAGTADPLNQRATAGWKAIKTAVRLVEQYMVRIETTSGVNDHVAN